MWLHTCLEAKVAHQTQKWSDREDHAPRISRANDASSTCAVLEVCLLSTIRSLFNASNGQHKICDVWTYSTNRCCLCCHLGCGVRRVRGGGSPMISNNMHVVVGTHIQVLSLHKLPSNFTTPLWVLIGGDGTWCIHWQAPRMTVLMSLCGVEAHHAHWVKRLLTW